MYIKQIQIKNYKSYLETQPLFFAPGINVIVGQNNAGKTALLESLGLAFRPDPHRSLATLPSPTGFVDLTSSANIVIAANRSEVHDLLNPGIVVMIPIPDVGWNRPNPTGYIVADKLSGQNLADWFMRKPRFEISVGRSSSNATGRLGWDATTFPSYGDYEAQREKFARCRVRSDRTLEYLSTEPSSPDTDVGIQVIAEGFRQRIYSFKAERFNVGYSKFNDNSQLLPNASNLPSVLNILQGNSYKYSYFNRMVSTVLPQVKWVSVRPRDADHVEVVVWSHEPSTGRIDLAVPLNECGTGVAQVLAMLYVVLMAGHPRAILIDEPQSFLHPGAIRKLFSILDDHEQHQFIIASHSPLAISTCRPASVHLLTFCEGRTAIRQVSVDETDDLRLFMSEVGASFADVFGADTVLWVEGPTEESCFPLIVREVLQRPLRGTVIRAMRTTDGFLGKHADLVLQLHEKISASGALIPPALAFIFDDEGRTKDVKDDLVRRSRGSARFLNRRMYECYLLVPGAILHLIRVLDTSSEVTEERIVEYLDEARTNVKYYDGPAPESGFEAKIHAARVLENLLGDLTGKRYTYRKPTHGPILTEWIIQHDPERLRDISDLLAGLIPASDHANG